MLLPVVAYHMRCCTCTVSQMRCVVQFLCADACMPEGLRARSACFLNDATRAWAAEMQPCAFGMPPWHVRRCGTACHARHVLGTRASMCYAMKLRCMPPRCLCFK